MIAVVGKDFPQEHMDYFASRNIDIRGLQRLDGETFHWVGKYADELDTRETLDTRLGVFADFRPQLEPAHCEVDLLFLGNIHPALQLDVVDQVQSPRLIAADTMNFWIEGNREVLADTLKRVGTLIINDEEARLLSKEHNLVRAANRIVKMGPQSVVIKRGGMPEHCCVRKRVSFSLRRCHWRMFETPPEQEIVLRGGLWVTWRMWGIFAPKLFATQ